MPLFYLSVCSSTPTLFGKVRNIVLNTTLITECLSPQYSSLIVIFAIYVTALLLVTHNTPQKIAQVQHKQMCYQKIAIDRFYASVNLSIQLSPS